MVERKNRIFERSNDDPYAVIEGDEVFDRWEVSAGYMKLLSFAILQEPIPSNLQEWLEKQTHDQATQNSGINIFQQAIKEYNNLLNNPGKLNYIILPRLVDQMFFSLALSEQVDSDVTLMYRRNRLFILAKVGSYEITAGDR